MTSVSRAYIIVFVSKKYIIIQKIMKKIILVCYLLLLFSNVVLAQSNLMTIERPCPEKGNMPMAILYTGDGGWRPYDEKLADSLNACGIPVLGINSLDYFRKRRTPQGSAVDLAKAITAYQEKWKKSKVVLIGYSFGAEVVPFIYNQLPTQLKSAVIGLVLLSPGTSSDFKTHATDRLGLLVQKWNYDVPQEIAGIKNIPVLVFWGEKEKAVMVSDKSQTNLSICYLPGGHNFKDTKAVVKKVKYMTQ
jgi:type IV secretory pathway VirJ component